MNANLVNILMWSRPYISAAYLVSLNICFWFLYRQRPICGVALIGAIYYTCNFWKHRIRPEVLIDPPDSEDWVNISTYDMERTTIEFGKTMWKSWVLMRKENYFMWLALTCVFWISLAKVASHVSFFTMLFLISNGSFLIGPFIRNLNLEVIFRKGDEISEDDLMPDFSDPAPRLEQVPKKESSKTEKLFEKSFGSTSDSSTDEFSPASTTVTDRMIIGDRERSNSPAVGPESLTPYGAAIPSHEDSSEDEFLFDAKHFESSSSSTSNSFELIHF